MPFDNRRLADLCGQFDEHLRQIESYLGVEINNRGNVFQIIGPRNSIQTAEEVLQKLYESTSAKESVNATKIYLLLQTASNEVERRKSQLDFDKATIKTKQMTIIPRSPNQYYYLKNIMEHDINFGIGPSGTGKTYLAVACAVAALENGTVRRIVLVRPAVEAGEKLGFLPGGMAQKVDPYLRPLYDALYEMIGIETVNKLIEKNIIEIAPLAFMRGRTLNDAFIILDESQNTTKEQMKMFLTRIGFGSKAVITGDITQVDLPKNVYSGLRHVITVLKDIDEITFTFFQAQDVVRHPLVQEIVKAYDSHERQ
ncbi:MAG: PhoH family protein [Gammaproteobacteria bacterium]|nr:PhoH family protein [Gammaproteobacteria bacterium]